MIAARAFCELRDERAIAPLLEMLNDVCPLVRVSVAYALGRNPSLSAVEPLIELLARDWNGYVRKGVVWALGNCGDRRAIEPLVHALKTCEANRHLLIRTNRERQDVNVRCARARPWRGKRQFGRVCSNGRSRKRA